MKIPSEPVAVRIKAAGTSAATDANDHWLLPRRPPACLPAGKLAPNEPDASMSNKGFAFIPKNMGMTQEKKRK